ncbi:FtsX-like permease family protein [Terriglobus albidus]|uniref:FtsX-like permease family protein n=1 Tax=Terriglobus albidus TaxID=1592106 RepID=A0A5B9EA37_9BACT|nr:FtsX-like permease family protein [Terriglobus albidus]
MNHISRRKKLGAASLAGAGSLMPRMATARAHGHAPLTICNSLCKDAPYSAKRSSRHHRRSHHAPSRHLRQYAQPQSKSGNQHRLLPRRLPLIVRLVARALHRNPFRHLFLRSPGSRHHRSRQCRANSVEQRTREFWIRMALGAPQWNVLFLTLASTARTTAIGLVLGGLLSIGLSDAVHRWTQSSMRDAAVLAIISAVFLVASAIACFLPARRATRIDPMVALRDN